MAVEVTFTLDLEDHRPAGFPRRYPQITEKILSFLDRHAIRATVFVLGRVALESPELIRHISSQGHELGYHTFDHVHLHRDTRSGFLEKSAAGKKYLEDLSGKAVHGFRAPAFSLTRESLWAVDAIRELGFTYSSSVLPVRNPINGFPGAPGRAFRWPNGLLEIPASVSRIGPVEIPCLGGFYLRYLPYFMIRRCLKQTTDQEHWLYCHPHDFDHGEPYYTIPGTSVVTSVLLWFNRKQTFKKLERLYSDALVAAAPPFIERIHGGDFDDAHTFRDF